MTTSDKSKAKKAGLSVIKVVSVPKKPVSKQDRFKNLKEQYDAAIKEQEDTFNESESIVNAVYG